MLDLKLCKIGTVSIDGDQIVCTGFEAEGAMCREVAGLAILWAIGELQKELAAIIDHPGGNRSVIGCADVDWTLQTR